MSHSSCEHPSCQRTPQGKCSNHCSLDLCHDHLTEHRNLFVVQFEKCLNKFHQMLNEYLEKLEESKMKVESRYQKELLAINEHYNNQLNLLDEKSLLVHSTENFIKKKLQLLLNVKNARAVLHQYDLEQIQLYQSKISESLSREVDPSLEEEIDSFACEADESDDQCSESFTRDDVQHYRGPCPLTQPGVFGLTDRHRIRFCSEERAKTPLYLVAHLHRYHHLHWALAYGLTKLVKKNSDPWTTPFFQSKTDLIDPKFHRSPCPMNRISSFRERSLCRKLVHRESMKQHLIHFHHLNSTLANRILQAVKTNDDLEEISMD